MYSPAAQHDGNDATYKISQHGPVAQGSILPVVYLHAYSRKHVYEHGTGIEYHQQQKEQNSHPNGAQLENVHQEIGRNMDAFCEKVRYTDKDEKDEYRKNLEKVLSLAEKAKDYITEPIFKTDKEEWNITYTVSKIKKMIKDNCNLQITSSESSSVHEKFLNKITKRKSSIARVKLFTLNYDTLFEQAARKGNYTIIDGFSFSIPRIFSGRHFDYDIVIRDGSRIKNEDNFVPRVFHLYKPHGSVDWEKRGNNVYQNKAEEISVEDSLMIFPQENKYEHSYEQPFFEMMTRFQAAYERLFQLQVNPL